ncbi:MAG: DUF11 domain-containing protein, partial [Holophagales bacterium]|nr:DUF11 domain-containing protein [Holophagales bacterium]
MPAGSMVTYTADCDIDPGASGSLVNTATVTASVTDPDPGNNSATDTDSLSGEADLAVRQLDSPDPVVLGSMLTYTIEVENLGPSAATSVMVLDTLPSGVVFSAAGGLGWSCGESGGIVTCTLPTLAPGLAEPISVVATVQGPGPLTNEVTVSSAETDPVGANNDSAEETSVLDVTDIPTLDSVGLALLILLLAVASLLRQRQDAR